MRTFTVTADTALSPAEAWERVTDWQRHGALVPLTSMRLDTEPPNRLGTVFTARTGIGPIGFDDPMAIVEWQPPVDDAPGHCRLEKRGRVIEGWAEITVESTSSGSRVTWREAAKPAHLPAFTDVISAAAGTFLFGRVLRKLVAAD